MSKFNFKWVTSGKHISHVNKSFYSILIKLFCTVSSESGIEFKKKKPTAIFSTEKLLKNLLFKN